ncbi:hypothetical protein QYE76_047148 [Lolium multiflorum]|uniref:F-box domain-containing protein n=1 Tax=Lolium multiflorum TaxID=4521 RepID=A0AAD8TNA6_LOLMU|nr:hypothetical protein QYE76_047148 [Lolium multiflorum]
MKNQRRKDRLSALPDDTLHRILSHLSSDKAVRTSSLSRRWHHVYAGVPVVDLVDPKSGRNKYDLPDHNCRITYEAKVCFDQKVTGAILCKAAGTPIRTFRLDAFNPPRGLLDQWIIIVVSSGVVEEIDVKLRYWEFSGRRLCPFGSSEKASPDFDKCDRKRYVNTQHHLFYCPALRRIRLTNWMLDLPPPLGAVMSSLVDTLCLTRIMDPKDQLQQLLANCPRLTDLTLQECPSLKKITVTSAHLRSFAMICCHNATRVKLTSSCLHSLHYQGGLPRKSLFKLANYAGVAALKIEICQDLSEKEPTEFAPANKLIRRCTKLAYLHLSLYPSMAYCSSFAVPSLPDLRQLGLQCCLWDDQDVRSVAVLLRDTHNLEVLSLFLQGPESESDTEHEDDDDGVDYTKPEDDGGDGDYTEPGDSGGDGVDYTEPGDNASDGVDYTAPEDHGNDCTDYTDPDCHADDGVDYSQLTDSFWQMYIRCLDDKLRRINIRDYEGLQLEKILVKFLLSKAVALEEVSVTLMVGRSQNKREIAKELRSWRLNPHTRVTINA